MTLGRGPVGRDLFRASRGKEPLCSPTLSIHLAVTLSIHLAGGAVAVATAMRNEPRPDARAGLKALTDAGIKIVMLTGDNRRTADAIGMQQLGIAVRALLPEDKQRIVAELQGQGLTVAKIGDGINDAPALAARRGQCDGRGTDVAPETADASRASWPSG
jgi:Zn2+/Cd2+-exporting ATPase